jgi:hypothetical protein
LLVLVWRGDEVRLDLHGLVCSSGEGYWVIVEVHLARHRFRIDWERPRGALVLLYCGVHGWIGRILQEGWVIGS